MTNEQTDAALILEGELKRRVREVLGNMVHEIVRAEMRAEFVEQKEVMMLEISISIGKSLRLIENEDRKPLWESTPEEFGLTREDLNQSHIEKVTHAVREQT